MIFVLVTDTEIKHITNNTIVGEFTDYTGPARSEFGGCLSRESGLLSVLFKKKRTSELAFWEIRLFHMIFGRKWTLLHAFGGKSGLFLAKYVLNCGPFWTLLDHRGGVFTPLAPPCLRA